MNDSQTVFLNGRRYDALTGKVIRDNSDSKHSILRPSMRPSHSDRHSEHPKNSHASTAKISSQQHKKSHSGQYFHDIAPHISRATEHSKTLMRNAVKNPKVVKLKNHQENAKKILNETVTKSFAVAEPAKETFANRARSVQRNDFVNRFSGNVAPVNNIPKAQVNTQVAAAPQNVPVQPVSLEINPQAIQTSTNSDLHLRNLDKLSQIEKRESIDDILSEASLRLADSHQPASKKEIRFYERWADKLRMSVKMLFALTITVFVIIFVSVSSYIFKYNIEVMLADSNTGVHAILPTYVPPHFGLSKVTYQNGKPTGNVNIFYTSNVPTSSYVLEEQATSWDNTALINSVVEPTVGFGYKTYQVGGRSVFFFNSRAVWIDSGIYFELSNSANLSPAQITKIVSTT